jgi:UDP-N-acetylglucosamine--N-acetylmuramyl-(pentapeptide) pyrophosphoryl-undecaprenol N-acetylglucosamine transferase
MSDKKILMVVGGTGGHIYPGIALAQKLSEQNPGISIDYVIDKKPIAYKILSGENNNIYKITSAPLPRKKIWHVVKFAFKLTKGLVESLILIKKIKPDVVVAFGAYMSVPVAIAAEILQVPVVLHEQNYFPGLANRFLALFAKKIAVSFDSTKGHFPANKVVLTGNPVRKDLFNVSRENSLKEFMLEEGKITVFVFGGSQGAESVNLSVIGALPYLEEFVDKIQFIHICGHNQLEKVTDEYAQYGFNARVYDYIKHIENAYCIADIIISRSGATTVAEIAALGKPSILIPYPGATSQHQLLNAKPLCNIGAAICCDDEKLSGESLALRFKPLLKDTGSIRDMSIKALPMRDRFRGASEKLAAVVMGEVKETNV